MTIGFGVCRLCSARNAGQRRELQACCAVAKECELLFHEGDLWGLSCRCILLGKLARGPGLVGGMEGMWHNGPSQQD